MKIRDNRLFQRYPCVGITLMYSPLINQNVNNLAEYLYNATSSDVSLSGLSFEISQSLEPGDKLVVLVSIPEQHASERLITEVRWCKALSSNSFRVGVEINKSEIISNDDPGNHVNIPVNLDAVPCEAELRCPACMQTSIFTFIDHQKVMNKGSMPLYNCSNCGSTRSLMGILASNRNPETG
ncbi:MAG: PilZ domain-containing protein [Gammaproteobacteria bacterium]|nr:PilZ domain-containing protein [Gammaproteobacteria bacterium]MCW8909001.1 PilZ domain-containing protein [Gammaproteobacteria bacterium]MCW9006176.1 PilZ domain-containing protein [Gammaproteobacteria bacterium]